MRVRITYYKHSGKWYSEGFYETKKEFIYEIYDEVRLMLLSGKRPGLVDGFDHFHVVVDCPDSETNVPQLMLGVA